ncbi:unnamed protein product [Cyberlindnera jadinii]|uniref:Ubiquitin-like domain-containing protein n=1 Tax=Cyberlindnera jadinii (strain ATCC 18201 / CBS 1600 / BCRC 20928 / JCM 3617 / NBRC 0987 / NRRL Y-1542) TaxID=983966 RepID=A0A0H5C317_CYBJN|nr:hypothetical protein CYBJADRAFT_165997 [Cyberlindnera jadinii NRRL Y-1542]ODV75242.1 hypothetical protein CYBJADRAFT_165997 [Cyberlindnera jadinii NRRL Y-1542]CEP22400.1 unnamed protein product [Cyberlindnera jadinii]
MAMRTRDMTMDIAAKHVELLLWSSDPLFDGFPNKLVRTTLDNTVQDVKEVISQRSFELTQQKNFNPSALNLYYKHNELSRFKVWAQCIDLSDPLIRIRVEFVHEKLAVREMVPSMVDIGIRTSTGRVLQMRKLMSVTVKELKCALVDYLHLESLFDITSFEYNGGVKIEDDSVTLHDLLQQDTVPFGLLNFYATVTGDFTVRLMSPREGVLRTNEMSVNLDTTIFTVKKYILDMYAGLTPDFTTSEIKILYFGRILEDDTRIRNISTPNTIATMTLHFIIQEPDHSNEHTGFWKDLQRGKIFDFYPKEPNPNFMVEHQRIKRLREQFKNNTDKEEFFPQEEALENLEHSTFINRDNFRNVGISSPSYSELSSTQNAHSNNSTDEHLPAEDTTNELIGTTDSTDSLEQTLFGYEFTVNDTHQQVKLSTDEVIVNNSDPSNPYIMVSSAGMKKLAELGISIVVPNVVQTVLREELAEDDNHLADANNEHANRGQLNNIHIRLFERIRDNLEPIGAFAANTLIFVMFYRALISPLEDSDYIYLIHTVVAIAYLFTHQPIREFFTQFIHNGSPHVRNLTQRATRLLHQLGWSRVTNGATRLVEQAIELENSQRLPRYLQYIYPFALSVFLCLVTLVPSGHTLTNRLIKEKKQREDELLARAADAERAEEHSQTGELGE